MQTERRLFDLVLITLQSQQVKREKGGWGGFTVTRVKEQRHLVYKSVAESFRLLQQGMSKNHRLIAVNQNDLLCTK